MSKTVTHETLAQFLSPTEMAGLQAEADGTFSVKTVEEFASSYRSGQPHGGAMRRTENSVGPEPGFEQTDPLDTAEVKRATSALERYMSECAARRRALEA